MVVTSASPAEKVVAIIQARMGSTRLPGKVMLSVHGVTVLEWVIRRVRACRWVDETVVATTRAPEDDVVVATAARAGALTFRGSVSNVLSRYCAVAMARAATAIVRVTADCPLFDPALLTAMLERWFALRAAGEPIDYLANTWNGRTWPRGLDAEIVSRAALTRVCLQARKPYELEHVTPYIYQHPEAFRLRGFPGTNDLSHHRWTLDTRADWALIEAIYRALGDETHMFPTADVLDFLAAHPELSTLNAHIQPKRLGE